MSEQHAPMNGTLRSLFVGLILVCATAMLGTMGWIYNRDMDRLEAAISNIAENQESLAIILTKLSNAREDRREMGREIEDIKKRLTKLRQRIRDDNTIAYFSDDEKQ